MRQKPKLIIKTVRPKGKEKELFLDGIFCPQLLQKYVPLPGFSPLVGMIGFLLKIINLKSNYTLADDRKKLILRG